MDLVAPFAGTVVSVRPAMSAPVPAGTPIIVLEAMKMEHELVAERDAVIRRLDVSVGDSVDRGQLLAELAEATANGDAPATDAGAAPDAPEREDLQQVRRRHELGLDSRRPEAVQKRHHKHRRTARENLDDLLDAGSFVEYGPLMYAAQERRRPRQELIERTPADGLVAGVGEIDGERCVAMSYDYTVLAGTQGMRNHQKKDRLFDRRAPPAARGSLRRRRRGPAGRR